MLFVIFNATVVYEVGLIRWAGVALLGWLLAGRLLAWAAKRTAAAADAEGKIVRSESGC
jgi:succinate dehydrogenase/fumarate reductase flavoprotein subunit